MDIYRWYHKLNLSSPCGSSGHACELFHPVLEIWCENNSRHSPKHWYGLKSTFLPHCTEQCTLYSTLHCILNSALYITLYFTQKPSGRLSWPQLLGNLPVFYALLTKFYFTMHCTIHCTLYNALYMVLYDTLYTVLYYALYMVLYDTLYTVLYNALYTVL